ncbi:MAG TPA: hypothetical protein VGB85_32635 [Nannocystis sp.]
MVVLLKSKDARAPVVPGATCTRRLHGRGVAGINVWTPDPDLGIF